MIKVLDIKPPFRIGRKQKRAVLDNNGLLVVLFPVGMELFADEYCHFINRKYPVNIDKCTQCGFEIDDEDCCECEGLQNG